MDPSPGPWAFHTHVYGLANVLLDRDGSVISCLCSANIRAEVVQALDATVEAPLWHDERMVALIKIAVQLLADAARFSILLFRPTRSVQAENLFLRRQLALFKERGIQPRRVDLATRIILAILARFFEWRDALFVILPNTMIRWHRAGWRLFWREKCRAGLPQIPVELRVLIGRMARENPVWGEERIASELLVKLGIQVSPRTVRKYIPKRLDGQPRGDQHWSTFLKNHAKAILACDFFGRSLRRVGCSTCSS